MPPQGDLLPPPNGCFAAEKCCAAAACASSDVEVLRRHHRTTHGHRSPARSMEVHAPAGSTLSSHVHGMLWNAYTAYSSIPSNTGFLIFVQVSDRDCEQFSNHPHMPLLSGRFSASRQPSRQSIELRMLQTQSDAGLEACHNLI